MTTPALNKIDFQSQWIPSINHLKPQPKPLNQRVYDFVKTIVFFIPNSLLEPIIRWMILPSSSPILKRIFKPQSKHFEEFWVNKSTDPKNIWNFAAPIRPMYNSIELSMTTQDNIKLKGHFIKHKDHDSNPNSRVIILFHGNGDNYQGGSPVWMMRLLQDSEIPYSFLLFNPRGVAESTQGIANASNLLLDSETAYQFAKDGLKISENRIDLYGQSLGAAQAAQLKKLHPETGGQVLLDRTFSSLDKEVSHILSGLPNFLRNFALNLIKRFGWEFDNYKALEKIKDPVHIFYHKKDGIIPEHCSLGRSVIDHQKELDLILKQRGIQSTLSNITVYEYSDNGNNDNYYHNAPLYQLTLIDPKTGASSDDYASGDLLKDIFHHQVTEQYRAVI